MRRQPLHKRIVGLLTVLFFTTLSPVWANNTIVLNDGEYAIVLDDCNNLTNGGQINGDETLTSETGYDAAPIVNVELPSGGSGELQYLWITTTDSPNAPVIYWTPISGSNSPDYDPGVLSQTTYFMRCSRRAGCVDYIAESNYITKTVVMCDNITDGGLIAPNQEGTAPYTATPLANLVLPSGGTGDIEYLWYMSLVGPPFIEDSPNWTPVSNSNTPNLDPGILNETTYYIRCSRRSNCTPYTGETNIITIIVNPDNNEECDNITNGGTVTANQEGTAPYTATPLTNLVLPSGGTGDIEYLWYMSLVGPPFIEDSPNWTPVPNSNTPNIDPGVLNETTYYIRCSRRSNCTFYTGETNIITITVNPNNNGGCDDVTEGGMIGFHQMSCGAFDPAELTNVVTPSGGTGELEYLWLSSTTTNIYVQGSPAWTPVDNYDNISYDPSTISQTTHYIRCVRRSGCPQFIGESNIVTLTVNPEPEIQVNQVVAVTCNYGGVIDISPVGEPPFTYNWSNGATTQDLSDLVAGIYSLTLTDVNGCTATETFEVDANDALNFSISIEADNVLCDAQGLGSATVTVSGEGTYTYLWNDANATTESTLSNVGAGTYSVTVTSDDGCSVVDEVTIIAAATFTLAAESTDEVCPGSADGTASVSVLGGTAPFTYLWNDSAASTTANVSNLTAGTYTVVVTDANGCSNTESVDITADQGIELNTLIQNISCAGGADGLISVMVSNAVTPYEYVWSGVTSTNGTASVLSVGTYSVTVTDANGCSKSTSVTLTEPEAVEANLQALDVICADDVTSLTATVTGGNTPYNYAWSNGNNTPFLANIGVGTYTLTVTDAFGCTNVQTQTIEALSNITIQTNGYNISCFGAADGGGSVTATGGVTPYSFEWSNGATTSIIQNLEQGAYSVTATDAAGCVATSTVVVAEPNALLTDLQVVNEISAFNVNDGVLSVVTNGGTMPYTYLWSNGATTSTIDNLSGGTYSVTVTDTNDCDVVATINLVEPEDPAISVGDYIWNDTNSDGIQQSYETGISGVTVYLVSVPDNTIIDTQITDVDGYYLFYDVTPGTYVIQIVLPTLPNNTVITEMNIGNNPAVDSDFDPTTGETLPFEIVENQENVLDLDAGIRPMCNNATDGGAIDGDQTICAGTLPDLLVNEQVPAGGTGQVEYLWLQGSALIYNGPQDPNWTEIPNSNAPDYQPPILNTTTYFIRCARREFCSEYSVESNVVTITVNYLPYANIVTAPSIACIDQWYDLAALPVGGIATYEWHFGEDSTPETASGQAIENVSWTQTGIKSVSLTVTREGCVNQTQRNILVNDCDGFNGQIENFVAEVVEENSNVALRWTTNNNDENCTFFVEAARANRSFVTIGTVAGGDLAANEYNFVDDRPMYGSNSYRIRCVRDGETGISDVEVVNFMPEGTPDLMVYPNPFDNTLKLSVFTEQAESMHIEILSAQGVKVYEQKIQEATYEREIDLSAQSIGIYIVKITYGEGKEIIEKIIKQ